MQLRRYCVTVGDNWTPTRCFWTLEGAKRWYLPFRDYANVWKWEYGGWSWLCGAADRKGIDLGEGRLVFASRIND
jgi:hypothetical protein